MYFLLAEMQLVICACIFCSIALHPWNVIYQVQVNQKPALSPIMNMFSKGTVLTTKNRPAAVSPMLQMTLKSSSDRGA